MNLVTVIPPPDTVTEDAMIDWEPFFLRFTPQALKACFHSWCLAGQAGTRNSNLFMAISQKL